MGKPKARSILYRLIEAGQLARRALHVPLGERGLQPGDDAILFLLHEQPGAVEADIATALGLDAAALAERVLRLSERDLVARRYPGLMLTGRGERIRAVLAENWNALEAALVGELTRKQRRTLRDTLGRFVDRLSP